jgi:thermosome
MDKNNNQIFTGENDRTTGKVAQRYNISIAKQVAETIRTTLGPKGMDKLLVNSLGDVIVTNDGVTILREMEITHPVAKMIFEIAQAQENEVGDGTTTSVVLAGELLSNAEELILKGIHPTIIIKGFNLACNESLKYLNEIAKTIDLNDKKTLKSIAETAMTGKGAEILKSHLADICVDSVTHIYDGSDTDINNIKIVRKQGSSIEESKLIKGVLIDKERVHEDMPKKVENAKIALLDVPIEVRETGIDAKIQITDANQIQSFLDKETELIQNLVQKIISSGCNVVFCQKGIDEFAQYLLAKKGIYALRRVTKSDMQKISKATKAKIITNIDELNDSVLGSSNEVYEKKIGDEYMTFIEGCINPKSVSILVRGGTEHVTEEIQRAVEDAIGDLISVSKENKILSGAGSCEIKLSKHLLKFSNTLSGKIQLALKAFAKSLEVIPATLAENSGGDPIDILTSLKSNSSIENVGISETGKLFDSLKEGVIEPFSLKKQAIKSSTEVATMILRIDDIIISQQEGNNQQHQFEKE